MTDYQITLTHADTGEEIELAGYWPLNAPIPRAGEVVHWWQDGTQEVAGIVVARRNFIVVRVEHDWRFMGTGSPKTHATVILHVRTIP